MDDATIAESDPATSESTGDCSLGVRDLTITGVRRFKPQLRDFRSLTSLPGSNESSQQQQGSSEGVPSKSAAPSPQEFRRQTSRAALTAVGFGGLRESLFSAVLSGSSGQPDIQFTLPPCGSPYFARRAGESGSNIDISRSGSPAALSLSSPARASSSTELRGCYPLGTLNPALYQRTSSEDRTDEGEGRWGKVCFALSYDASEERLHIVLRRASGLPAAPPGDATDVCLPIARLCLLPDERRYLQTRLRKRTPNPRFNEEFCFHVAQTLLADRSLRITFYDMDRRQKQHPVGHVTLALKELELGGQQAVREFQLEISPPGTAGVVCPGPCKGPREIGLQMLAALSFSPALERLTVSVLEARLNQGCTFGGSDLFARVSLVQQARAVKCKRTATAKRVPSPGLARFNESFSFHVAAGALDTCSLAIHVLRPGTGLAKDGMPLVTCKINSENLLQQLLKRGFLKQYDHALGRVALGSHMFARGSGLEHWRRMLACPTERVQQWHCLVRD